MTPAPRGRYLLPPTNCPGKVSMYDDVSLVVTSGIHQGATFALKNDEVTIGRHGDCDIVLADPSVADRHIRIIRDGHRIIVDCLDAPVDLKHRDRRLRVEPEYSQLVVPPILMRLGDVVLNLTPQQDAAVPRLQHDSQSATMPGLLSKPLIPAGFAAACLAVLLVTGMGSFSPSKPVTSLSTSTSSVDSARLEQDLALSRQASRQADEDFSSRGQTSSGVTGRSDSASGVSTDEAWRSLRNYLVSAGLEGEIEVTPGKDALVARGSLPDSLISQWTEAHIWYDGRYGAYVPLITEVTRKADNPRPKDPIILMRALYLGKNPYIIAKNGQKYHQGSILNNGWMIEKINPDSVTVSLGDRRVSLEL